MDIHTFIANYQEAFGQHAELPIAFWYSDRMGASTEKVTGCLFKCMKQVRDGKIVSLSNKTITCGGGKFYTGFTEMPERVPGFVSLKEKYKKTPEMVVDFVNELQISRTDKAYLHFARIDKIPSFDEVEGRAVPANSRHSIRTGDMDLLRQQCIGCRSSPIRLRLLFRHYPNHH